MAKLETAMNWFRLALFGAVTVLFDQIKTLLSANLSQGTINILSVFVIIFVFHLIATLADVAVGQMVWLRRLIVGSEFVEGEWVHEVRDAEGKPVSVGFVSIDYHDGALLISGDAYTQSAFLLNFTSELSSYSNYILSFTYSQFGRMQSKSGFEMGLYGFAKYRFTPRKTGPIFCDGVFVEGSSKQVFQLTGERLKGEMSGPDKQEEARRRLARMDSSARVVPT